MNVLLEKSQFPRLWQVMEDVYFIPMMTPSRVDPSGPWEVPFRYLTKFPEFEACISSMVEDELEIVKYGDTDGITNVPPTRPEPIAKELVAFLTDFFHHWETV